MTTIGKNYISNIYTVASIALFTHLDLDPVWLRLREGILDSKSRLRPP